MANKKVKKNLQEVKSPAVVSQNSPIGMAQSFLSSGGDLASLEKMMDLEERWNEKLAKKAYISAMVEAQKAMPVIYEGRKNQQTNSSYSAYKDIVKDAKPIYTGAGLSVSFYEEETEKENYIKFCADVYHVDGHSKTFKTELPIDDTGPKGTKVKTTLHGTKSAFSYGRGILLCNIFNIPTSADVDDDGNSACMEFITSDQAKQIEKGIKEKGIDINEVLKFAGAETVDTITQDKFNQIMSNIKATKCE